MAHQRTKYFSVKDTNPTIRAKNPSKGPCTSFDLVEDMLYLYVKIEKAIRLPVLVAKAEVEIGNYRGATTTTSVSPSGEFIWHRVFAFSESRIQSESVKILVKDENNVVMGMYSFRVEGAVKRVRPDPPLAAQWYPLMDPIRNMAFGGQLMMAYWFGTQADEDYNRASHSDAAAALSPEALRSIRPTEYNTKFWYLRVNVIAVQDLVIPGINSRVQPACIYVKAHHPTLPDTAATTRPCLTMTSGAKWDEDLMFVVGEPFYETLHVGVYEIDPTLPPAVQQKEVLLGMCRIPLGQVYRRLNTLPIASEWHDLNFMEGEGTGTRFASKINMRISLDGGYHVIDEPTEFSSDLRPSEKGLWKPALGVFELGIISASGLSSIVEGKASVDGFCVAKYGPKWVKTKTVLDDCSPKWNEQHTWEVYDHCTVITIAVFDHNLANKGNFQPTAIGKVRIRLSDLDLNEVYTKSYPLVCLEASGVKKRGELQLCFRFRCPSMLNVYLRYGQPLLPKMHYVLPLSVLQIRILRDEAVRLAQHKLNMAESPPHPEVVRYVLDDNMHGFSLRRAKANYRRCGLLLETFLYYKHCFGQLQEWTNPLQSFAFIICLMVFTWLPNLALASMFFILTGQGTLRYWKRPKQLPHIDTELSLVHGVPDDVIAEEFDTVPTKLPPETPPEIVAARNRILAMRYLRLQDSMLTCQVVLGDIATTMERVAALLSWRDKKATLLVMIFFFIAGLWFYYDYSVQTIFFLIILDKMCRIKFLWIFHNFIRRMPSKRGSML